MLQIKDLALMQAVLHQQLREGVRILVLEGLTEALVDRRPHLECATERAATPVVGCLVSEAG